MLTVKALQDAQQELFDRATAIVNVATEEKRDLTDEETKEIDAINGVGKQGDPNYKPGKIDDIQAKLDRVLKIEAQQKRIAAERARGMFDQNGLVQTRETTWDQMTVPIHAMARTKPKAFIGPNAEREAYAAGKFWAAVLFKDDNAATWLDDHGLRLQNGFGVQNAMSTSSNPSAGFLVPSFLDSAIIRNVELYGVFRKYARVYPMGPGETVVPRRTGGLTSYFTTENSDITASDITTDQVVLNAKTLGTLTKVSNELNADSVVALGDLLTLEIAQSFAIKEDQCGFLGDGTSTYGGIRGLKSALAAGSIQTAGAGVDTAAEIVIGEYQSAMAKLLQLPGIQPKWFCHSAFFYASMERLALAAGGNSTANYASGMGPMFLGYPVVFTQCLESSLGDISDLQYTFFGDLSMTATLGDRAGISVAADSSVYFASNATAVRGLERFDINVHEIGTASAGGPMIRMVAGS